MATEVCQLWVILPNGLCTIHRDYSSHEQRPNEDPVVSQVFTGFVSVIFSFAEKLGEEGIEKIQMKNSEIHYTKTNQYILALQVPLKSRIPKIRDYFDKLCQLLDKDGFFLFKHEFVADKATDRYQHLIDKIDKILGHCSAEIVLREELKLTDILIDYLIENKLTPSEAIDKIKDILNERELQKREMKRRILNVAETVKKTIVDLDDEHDYKEKISKLLDNLFSKAISSDI
ncbi:MAG: hypothetical protein ACFFC7_10870 [Candidatus Hermodarchaeota archaeon]